ncbi:UBX domain protein [Cordyceps militaris CM01]|uniref:UBX domain-containing protein 2 n=1 Tax=Cordyceps militaris (strain CM01) TaxID=983644 RepID=G3JMA9_CORMM|nr:UBX domain protein [Cordyceps militaris CM01]EGX89997.1 UBX domain protein [Cordyceps militaris CM01]
MFFQGSIQEGISSAVGQQKLLLCFVTDGNDESQIWEEEYLQNESVNGLIAAKAVALRLKAGSDEAGYLAQIFPLPKTPTIVIMKHGELKEYIASGTTKEDLLRRLANVFAVAPVPMPTPAPSTPSGATTAPTPTPNSESSAIPSSSIPVGSPESDGSENVRRILAERAAKAQKVAAASQSKEVDAAAAAASASKGKGRAAAEIPAAPSQTEAQREATELIRKKKAQQNDERRRILKRIEDDKAARRGLAAQRKKQRQEDQAAQESEAKEQQAARTVSRSNLGSAAAIQVRLSDGSTLRNKFQATKSIKDIRSWVDKERSDGQGPYFFKQVLTPLPNKSIDITEEDKSLGALGLAPSSTLLLIPIQRFASAYESQFPSQGFFGQIMGLIFGLFTWLMGLIGLGGEAAQPAAQARSQQPANTATALQNQRVQAFQNPNDRRGDQQLYNGNSLNFEPRPDEDEK